MEPIEYKGEDLNIGDMFWDKQWGQCIVDKLEIVFCTCGATKDFIIHYTDARTSHPHKTEMGLLKQKITKWTPRKGGVKR